MSELYDRIDTANKFTPPPATEIPVKDQSTQAAFGLEWAARQACRPETPPPAQMPPIIPVAS